MKIYLMKALAGAFLLSSVFSVFANDLISSEARSAGMGGVGIAIKNRPPQIKGNPALLSFGKNEFQISIPSGKVTHSGLEMNEIQSWFPSSFVSNTFQSKISQAQEQLHEKASEAGDAKISIAYGRWHVGVDNFATQHTEANQTLLTWANSDKSFPPPFNGSIHTIAHGEFRGEISYAFPVNKHNQDTLQIGIRAHATKSYFAHRYLDVMTVLTGKGNTYAPEMNGSSFLEKMGFGLDVGMYFEPKNRKDIGFGVVLENIIAPNAAFQATNANGNPITINKKNFSAHLGIAYSPAQNLLLACEVHDTMNTMKSREIRLGAEWTINPEFSVRAGYASQHGYTLGLSYQDMHVAITRDSHLIFSATTRF